MRVIKKIGEWFDHRLQLAAPIREAAEHPVPRNTASWFYVFGSAALTIFLLQLVKPGDACLSVSEKADVPELLAEKLVVRIAQQLD